jgi:tetratricopeptide (TPR) repeat protein
LIFLAVTGRITDPLLRVQLVGGESDRLWARHIEAVCQIKGLPTMDIIGLCETYANATSAYEEGATTFGMRLPMKQDDFVRACLLKVEEGGSPLAEMARLIDEASKHENAGDYEKAASCIERLLELDPKSPTRWHTLGRIRTRQKCHQEAEHCYRRSLEIDPQSANVRGDLAILLAGLGRANEAITELDKCTDEQKLLKEWAFAHAIALLRSGRGEEAKKEYLKCVTAHFKLGPCYSGLTEACKNLGDLKAAREYKKRMEELDASPTRADGGACP